MIFITTPGTPRHLHIGRALVMIGCGQLRITIDRKTAIVPQGFRKLSNGDYQKTYGRSMVQSFFSDLSLVA